MIRLTLTPPSDKSDRAADRFPAAQPTGDRIGLPHDPCDWIDDLVAAQTKWNHHTQSAATRGFRDNTVYLC